MAEHHMSISSPWAEFILSGEKIFEGRRVTDKTLAIKVDDYIVFSHKTNLSFPPFRKRVVGIRNYPSFEVALKDLGLDRTLPGVKTIQEGIDIYAEYVSLKTQQKEGIFMFELEDNSSPSNIVSCLKCSRVQEMPCTSSGNRLSYELIS